MPMKELTERNEEIIRMFRAKKPRRGYKKIAKIFGLDYTRVRDIIKADEKKRQDSGVDK